MIGLLLIFGVKSEPFFCCGGSDYREFHIYGKMYDIYDISMKELYE
jgi:hypothetical protein